MHTRRDADGRRNSTTINLKTQLAIDLPWTAARTACTVKEKTAIGCQLEVRDVPAWTQDGLSQWREVSRTDREEIRNPIGFQREVAGCKRQQSAPRFGRCTG